MVVSTSRTKQCAQVSASFVSLLDESDELLVREENFARRIVSLDKSFTRPTT